MSRSQRWAAASLLTLALVPGLAWKGESASGVRPISEVLEKAEEGDYVAVEGEVVSVESGPGSLRLATLDDGTGEVVVAVPEHLRRNIEREPGDDPVGARFRVSGKWDHGYLAQDRYGIRAQQIERLSEP